MAALVRPILRLIALVVMDSSFSNRIVIACDKLSPCVWAFRNCCCVLTMVSIVIFLFVSFVLYG